MSANASGVAIPPPPGGHGGMDRGRANSALSGRLRAASEMMREGVISKEENAMMKQLILNNTSDPSFREQFDIARKTKDPEAIRRLFKNHNSDGGSNGHHMTSSGSHGSLSQAFINDSIMMDLTDMSLGDVDDFSSFLDDFSADPIMQHPTAASASLQPTAASAPQPQYFGATARPPHTAADTQQGPGHQQRHSVGFVTEFGAQMAAPTKTNQGRPEYTRKRQASRSAPGPVVAKINANSAGSAAIAPSAAGPNAGRERVGSRPVDLHTASSAAAAVGLTAARGRAPTYTRANAQQRSSHPGIKSEATSPYAASPANASSAPSAASAAAAAMRGRAAGPSRVGGAAPRMNPMYHHQHGMVASHVVGRPGLGSSAAHVRLGSPSGSSAAGDDEEDEERSGIAKTRKNERERKRRLAVTQGFDELYKLLKSLEEERHSTGTIDKSPERLSILSTSKLDKASILRNSIDKIRSLEGEVVGLRKENDRLSHLIQQRHKR
ncbi:Hypothetical Protein FCC1311_112692 [Hondaea fermentalgiana]|uniref:BHLH domain-containing protein n=1 Tax=Hondaea fermentalgiana TaxID=2315210 RepID=A0A2R5GW33_9STRA|nr:Hypothetical Protein FCC1311_112692 [Hondaea fermentalgiana]|eukprot:GBG35046.1 Hypothetical Protein FCC1311_112692 [Hondaea fermentalgiana]